MEYTAEVQLVAQVFDQSGDNINCPSIFELSQSKLGREGPVLLRS